MEIIGWIGSFLLTFCTVPQCIQTYKTKKAGDLSLTFLAMWFGGMIFILTYIVLMNMQTGIYQWPLLLNYSFNIFMAIYLLYAKITYGGESCSTQN